MTIFLLILKSIGLILLILLVIVFYLLIVPIHFRVGISKCDGYILDLRLFTSLRFVKLKAIYNKQFNYSIKLLWGAIDVASTAKDNSKNKKEKKPTDTSKKQKKKRTITEIVEAIIAARDLISTLLHMLPGLIRSFHLKIKAADCSFSLGECDKTAFYYGVLMTIPGALSKQVIIEPNISSEETYLEGNIKIYGHFYLIVLLAYAIKLLRNDDLRTLVK